MVNLQNSHRANGLKYVEFELWDNAGLTYVYIAKGSICYTGLYMPIIINGDL